MSLLVPFGFPGTVLASGIFLRSWPKFFILKLFKKGSIALAVLRGRRTEERALYLVLFSVEMLASLFFVKIIMYFSCHSVQKAVFRNLY